MAVLLKATTDDVLQMAKDMLDMVEPSLKEKSEAERKEIDEIMRRCISNEIQLCDALGDISEAQLPDEEVIEKMKKLLSNADFEMISGYVDQETYTVDIQSSEATVQREGKQFVDTIPLNSMAGITDSSTIQIVSLVAECIFFVLGIIGIKISVKEALMRKIMKQIMPVVKQPAFQRILNEFLRTWKKGSAIDKAKAVFNLIKETNSLGIFMKVVKLAFEEMSLWDKTKAVAQVVAMIVAAFASGGAALIAKIALSINDAVNLTKKVINLVKLKDMASAF